jgi:riboflavin synthase, alpha subunit
MFTGIVRYLGIVDDVRISDNRSALTLTVDIGYLADDTKVGDSISINGVCLTVVSKDSNSNKVTFNVIGETVKRTNLGMIKKGDRVNIEPSLRVGDSIDGHFVLGHVDCMGTIVDKVEEKDQVVMSIRVDNKDIMRYIAEKGSIAVDGVSLTVVSCSNDIFTVALIPHTLDVTTLGIKGKGEKVNIEVDILARYVMKSTNILVNT